MTQDQILTTLNEATETFLQSAHAMMTSTAAPQKDRRRTLRFTLIATALLVLVTIPIAVIIASHYGIAPPPPLPTTTTDTTAVPATNEKVYQSITDIPGAVRVNTENAIGKITPSDKYPPDEYVQKMKSATARVNFVGTASFVEAVSVSDGNHNWTIMTFDVTVEKAILNTEAGKTYRILIVCYYTNSELINIHQKKYIPDEGMQLLNDPRAFFSLYPIIRHYWTPIINGAPMDLSSYADYGDSIIHETDGDGFYYFNSRIDFSEIIPDDTK